MIKLLIILGTLVMTIRAVPGYGYGRIMPPPTFGFAAPAPMTILAAAPSPYMTQAAPMMTYASAGPSCLMAAPHMPQTMTILTAAPAPFMAQHPTPTIILAAPIAFTGEKPFRFNTFRGGRYA
ncbi:hypothetical protein DERP_012115 [Dermatophagoides pteronyssinus]|uniref:Uncharacterized protein n=3 Tax=Dermatophagoides pteronyssinus TaxID=6956 RepID=A0ABQ8ITZ0_DERPT|nr:uncharacterized protein LOC113798096 [Dermatophagoides pteronyssinus]KAH9413781.1 hypothetical protein DERP_012115 [Dermatophagoides pteronyssinus]